ncbi:hypothetical protein [Jatrophihabitans endophyticus]|uniref:hypothetical protein n=1 Tax=Jatrophihabitans endophyticus TaxID=1206085 RepID=UPI001A0AFEC9|nr:hypothetical protein [Jatrophihabitans endophyticus]MBE7189817.1 hypothetical protein [Jatrophihabitans endophyticus]
MSTAAAPAPAAPPPASARALRARLFAFVMPVYFVVGLAATLVVALHHPQPHDLSLTIAGPTSSTSRIAAGLQQNSPGSFDVRTTADAATARAAVQRRDTVGAIVLGGTLQQPTVTTYVASAGGRSAASAVEGVGQTLATQLKATSSVVDLAPLNSHDTLGTGLFYVFAYSSIGGYLTLIVLTQVLPKARLRTRYGIAAGAAVLVPPIVFGLASIFFDGFGVGFGQLMAVLGIDALYTLTVALVVVLVEQLLGRAAIFGVMPVVVMFNLPSAGGASPESMLPGFFQALHSFWFGSGAFEAIRDVVYFPAADPVRWIMQLLLWTIGLVLATLLVESARVIWRLQTVVIRQQQHSNTLREHLELLSVPKQAPLTRTAITADLPPAPHAADDSADTQQPSETVTQ